MPSCGPPEARPCEGPMLDSLSTDAFSIKRTDHQCDSNPLQYRRKRTTLGVGSMFAACFLCWSRHLVSPRDILLKFSYHSIHTICIPQECIAVSQFLGALTLRKYAPLLPAVRCTRTTNISLIIPQVHACHSSLSIP